MTHLHSAAKVILKKLGNRITINDKDFFSDVPPAAEKFYKFSPLKTKLEVGTRLIDDEDLPEIINLSFPDLRQKYGLTIYKINIENDAQKWYKNQRAIFYIGKKTKGVPGEISDQQFARRGFSIEMDVKNMLVRALGEGLGNIRGKYSAGDITPWIPLGPERHRGDNLRTQRGYEYSSWDEYSSTLYDQWNGKEIKEEPVEIEEIPVMILDDGKSILCIPKLKEKVQKTLIVGKTGKGKTFATISFTSRIPYKFGDEVGILNDAFDQFTEIMVPQDNTDFIYKLARIGEEPKPLPAINLFMSGPNVNIRYNDEAAGFRLVVDFKDLCLRYPFWSYGVGKWDLGKAIKYMSPDLINQIQDCKNAKDIRNKLYTIIEGASDDKGKQQMIYKWEAAFENIIRDQFTSNLFMHEESTSAEWSCEITINGKKQELSGHPFIIAMYSGLIPVLNNSAVKTKAIMPKQTVDLLKKILEWQDFMRPKGCMKRIWLVWDELKDLLKRENKEVYPAFEEFFTQARFRLAGCIGNIQEYSKLTDSIRNNVDYLLVFELQTKEERNAIAEDFDCKEQMNTIRELKKFECLFVAREKVVIYDVDGRRREEEGGLWKGIVIPPLCTTKKPSSGVVN